MKESEKLPIISPCGDEIKEGGIFYQVEKANYTSFCGCKHKSWSGTQDIKILKHKIIKVNRNANVRSFTLRSDRGCETTYSVKNECVSKTLFTRLGNAKKYCKELHDGDIRKATESMNRSKTSYELKKKTVAKLKKIKF